MTRAAKATDDKSACTGNVTSDINKCAQKSTTVAFKDTSGACLVYTGAYAAADGRCMTRAAKATDDKSACTGNVTSDVQNCVTNSTTDAFLKDGVCVVYTGAYALDGSCMTRAARSTDDKTACQNAGNDPNGCAAKIGQLDATTGLYYTGGFNPNTGVCRLTSAQ